MESRYNSYNEKSVFTDLDKKQIVKKIFIAADYVLIEDSVSTVKWKIENETRKIAGWECRKAVGKINDSVYVVAFYCPEIIPQLGPELFTGLPGTILGLAIPQYYTTWFATKVELANNDENKIVAPSIKKAKLYSKKELAELLMQKDKTKSIKDLMTSLSKYTL